jgi:hypothetical protein
VVERGRRRRVCSALIAFATNLRMTAGEFDRSRLYKSTKVLIVESWVHSFLNSNPSVSQTCNGNSLLPV